MNIHQEPTFGSALALLNEKRKMQDTEEKIAKSP